MKKNVLVAALLCAAFFCDAQSVQVYAGGGAGAFNSRWRDAAPVICAGLLVDDPINDRAGIVYGLSYRQRAESAVNTLLHTAQFDVSGRYTFGRFSVSAGGFFGLAAGYRSDEYQGFGKLEYGSGVGVAWAVAFRVSDRIGLRVMYDHGLTDLLPEFQGTTTAQGAWLCVAFLLK